MRGWYLQLYQSFSSKSVAFIPLGTASCERGEVAVGGGLKSAGCTCLSTREMGPGARQDTLEDHFGSGNWQKTVGLGKSTQTAVSDTLLTLSR